MNKWKVIRCDGVQAGIAKEGCNSPFVTLFYTDAETVVQEHNDEVESNQIRWLSEKETE